MDRWDNTGIQCSKCKGKNGPPVGMIRIPTENDDYVCPACIRAELAKLQAELTRLRSIASGRAMDLIRIGNELITASVYTDSGKKGSDPCTD